MQLRNHTDWYNVTKHFLLLEHFFLKSTPMMLNQHKIGAISNGAHAESIDKFCWSIANHIRRVYKILFSCNFIMFCSLFSFVVATASIYFFKSRQQTPLTLIRERTRRLPSVMMNSAECNFHNAAGGNVFIE